MVNHRANGAIHDDGSLSKRLDEAFAILDCEDSPERATASAKPTYQTGNILSAPAARERLTTAVKAFIEFAHAHYAKGGEASVYAIKAITGLGKTEEVARLIASIRQHGPQDSPLVTKPWLVLVPTHRLG